MESKLKFITMKKSILSLLLVFGLFACSDDNENNTLPEFKTLQEALLGQEWRVYRDEQTFNDLDGFPQTVNMIHLNGANCSDKVGLSFKEGGTILIDDNGAVCSTQNGSWPFEFTEGVYEVNGDSLTFNAGYAVAFGKVTSFSRERITLEHYEYQEGVSPIFFYTELIPFRK